MKYETPAGVISRELKRIDDLIEQAKEELQRDAQSHSARLDSLHKQRGALMDGLVALDVAKVRMQEHAGAGKQDPYQGDVTHIGEQCEASEPKSSFVQVVGGYKQNASQISDAERASIRLDIVMALIRSPGMFSPSGLISTAATLEAYVIGGNSNGTD